MAASIKSKFLDGKMSRLADKEEKVKEILDTISIPGRGATMSASIYWRDEFSRLAKVICQLDTEECPECDGKGYRTAEGIYSNWEGTTRQPCERCNSTGRISKSELDKVEIRREGMEEIAVLLPKEKSLLEEAAYTGGDVSKKWINDRGNYISGYNDALKQIKQALKRGEL